MTLVGCRSPELRVQPRLHEHSKRNEINRFACAEAAHTKGACCLARDSLGSNFSHSVGGVEHLAIPEAAILREDSSAEALPALARQSKDMNHSGGFLLMAAARGGKNRGEAAKIGERDRQAAFEDRAAR